MLAVLYRLFLRTQVNRTRVIALLALGLVGIAVAVAVRSGDGSLSDAVDYVNGFGLVLLVPIATLTFASATFGDLVEDRTLVYVWLRPVARWQLAVAAAASSFTVVVPIVATPLVLGAAVTGHGNDLVVATLVATVVGVAAYSALFVLLGLLSRRPMLWGLGYILIWEGFIARAGGFANNLAVRTYTRSILARVTDVRLDLAEETMATSLLVPAVVIVTTLVLATRLLVRRDVA